jgi:polar amino acid transport system ATP-binding protein
MQDSDPILSVRGLTKRFGETEVLAGIDLDVASGEVICIIGPSGSGKSTLLRCLNLLETPDGGEIRFLGKSVGELASQNGRVSALARNALRAEIGMVFQQFNLWPHRTVLENVILAPMLVRGSSRREAEAQARTLLDKVGLSDKADALPSRLSGGQQQRVAIARALAMRPRVMLFDEATSALDPELVGEVLNVMRMLAGDGMTMVCVTHEIDFASAAADRVVFIDSGCVVEQGPPSQIFEQPRQERTRRFLSRSRIVPDIDLAPARTVLS